MIQHEIVLVPKGVQPRAQESPRPARQRVASSDEPYDLTCFNLASICGRLLSSAQAEISAWIHEGRRLSSGAL